MSKKKNREPKVHTCFLESVNCIKDAFEYYFREGKGRISSEYYININKCLGCTIFLEYNNENEDDEVITSYNN